MPLNSSDLEKIQIACTLIEEDGIDGFHAAKDSVGYENALLLLVAHMRRQYGSMNSYPAAGLVSGKVEDFFLQIHTYFIENHPNKKVDPVDNDISDEVEISADQKRFFDFVEKLSQEMGVSESKLILAIGEKCVFVGNPLCLQYFLRNIPALVVNESIN